VDLALGLASQDVSLSAGDFKCRTQLLLYRETMSTPSITPTTSPVKKSPFRRTDDPVSETTSPKLGVLPPEKLRTKIHARQWSSPPRSGVSRAKSPEYRLSSNSSSVGQTEKSPLGSPFKAPLGLPGTIALKNAHPEYWFFLPGAKGQKAIENGERLLKHAIDFDFESGLDEVELAPYETLEYPMDELKNTGRTLLLPVACNGQLTTDEFLNNLKVGLERLNSAEQTMFQYLVVKTKNTTGVKGLDRFGDIVPRVFSLAHKLNVLEVSSDGQREAADKEVRAEAKFLVKEMWPGRRERLHRSLDANLRKGDEIVKSLEALRKKFKD
jgi:hypothetical protein